MPLQNPFHFQAAPNKVGDYFQQAGQSMGDSFDRYFERRDKEAAMGGAVADSVKRGVLPESAIDYFNQGNRRDKNRLFSEAMAGNAFQQYFQKREDEENARLAQEALAYARMGQADRHHADRMALDAEGFAPDPEIMEQAAAAGYFFMPQSRKGGSWGRRFDAGAEPTVFETQDGGQVLRFPDGRTVYSRGQQGKLKTYTQPEADALAKWEKSLAAGTRALKDLESGKGSYWSKAGRQEAIDKRIEENLALSIKIQALREGRVEGGATQTGGTMPRFNNPEQQAAYDWAVKNQHDPRAARVLQKLQAGQ